MFPPFPPAGELVLLTLTEFFFGVGYDRAVKTFGKEHGRLFRFLVSWSVVFGTAGTLTIKALFLWGWKFEETLSPGAGV